MATPGVDKLGEHCSQEMLNSCRKFVWMKICYWKFKGNLNTHVPLWAQQHMVGRHYSLNLKPWSARTLYVYAHADLAQKYSIGLQEIFLSSLCSQEENYFPALGNPLILSIPPSPTYPVHLPLTIHTTFPLPANTYHSDPKIMGGLTGGLKHPLESLSPLL
jgi:hypothetical protein